MDEKEIKVEVLNYLIESGRLSRRSVIANEFSLAKASVRADIAVLSEEFIGVEIKSAKDSLKRLTQQMLAYQKYFDVVVLVIASKHVKAVQIADYPGVEILEINEAGQFRQLSPLDRKVAADWNCLADLLTKAETRRFFGPTKNAHQFGTRLIPEIPSDCRQAFRDAFISRYVENSEVFWQRVRRRKVKMSDLEILSNYRDIRQATIAHQQQKEQGWKNWLVELNQFTPWLSEAFQSDQASSVSYIASGSS